MQIAYEKLRRLSQPEYATGHPMSIGGLLRSETPGNAFAMADAAMWVESAHAFLLQEARAFYTKALQGKPFTEPDTVNFRMASQVARENAQKTVERLWGPENPVSLL